MRIIKIIEATIKSLGMISVFSLGSLMFLGAIDVIGRYVFNYPIKGTLEISQILLAALVFFGLAYTQIEHKHITVGLAFSKLPPKLRKIISIVNYLLVFIVFALMTWSATATAINMWNTKRLVANLPVQMYPFQLFVSLGSSSLCLVLIIQLLHMFKSDAD